jgi:hypothetical protein
MLNDGNGMVVSNAAVAVSEIQKFRGSKIVKVDKALLH